MSPAPCRPERSPPGAQLPVLSGGAAILPPAPHASRSFVLAAARLRALHPDPLLTAGDQPLPRRGTDEPGPALTPAPVFIERSVASVDVASQGRSSGGSRARVRRLFRTWERNRSRYGAADLDWVAADINDRPRA